MADKRVRPSRERTAVDRPSSISAPTLGGADPAPDDGAFALGTVVAGRYRILEPLGAGGMGAVYRARDLTLGADVAVKMLSPDLAGDPARVDHFRREVLLARRVTHPNVCRLHDIVEESGGWFITMEHVDGESLADRLRRDDGDIDLAFALRVIRDLASGLAAAHRVGVVHRDLKPDNVLLAADGGRAVIADFGIAVEVNQLGQAVVDRAGTRGYMSPEQAAGAEIDARTDVFALGVLAFRMLAGELPPAAPTTVARTEESEPPVPIPEAIGPGLAALIERCLRTDPDERYADASGVVEALDAIEAPPRRRRRLWLGLAAVPLAAAAAIAGLMLSGSGGPLPLAPPRQVVITEIDAGAVGGARAGWIDAALGRRLVNELDDAWALEARLAGDRGPALSALDASAAVSVGADGRGLTAEVTARGRGGERRTTVRGAAVRELSIEIAAAIVEVAVPDRLRRPLAVDLELTGSADPEAWRQIRRSQRASVRQLWPLARELSAAALERDRDSVVGNLERGWTFAARDPARLPYFRAAIEGAGPGLAPGWRHAVAFAEATLSSRRAAIDDAVDATLSSPLTYRQRWYFTHRITYAQWYQGRREDMLAHLEALESRYPRSAGAAKLLANYYLARDDDEAREQSLRHARIAVARGADDVASRAELARALLWNGERPAALEQVALIEAADAREKRWAVAGGEQTNSLFDLYMALGDFAGADRAARRLETGSDSERGRGQLSRALLSFYRGDNATGFARLERAAEAFDASGLGELIGSARGQIAAVAHALGRRSLVLETVGAMPESAVRPFHRLIAAIASGRPTDPITEALPASHAERAYLQAIAAAAAADWERVLELEEGVVRWRRHIRARHVLGQAHEAAGDLRAALAHYERLAFHRYGWSVPIWANRALLAAARVRAELGDTDEARAHYRAYLQRLDQAPPGHPGIAEARRSLARL